MSLRVGARIAVGEKKEDALDFALWNKRKTARFIGKVHGVKGDQVGILSVQQWPKSTWAKRLIFMQVVRI